MKQKAFSVRDSKAEIYHLPFFSNTTADAERSFRATVNNPQTTIHQFPEDFDLWMIGEYDQSVGMLIPLQTPVHMLKAVAVKNPETPRELSQNNH